MLDAILSLIAPHCCVACGELGSLWCKACRQDAPLVAERCYKCHTLSKAGRTCAACRRKSALFTVQAATRYDRYAKALVWRLKFGRARAAGKPAGFLLAERVHLPAGCVIVHVPTVTNRVRQRGYDQSALIARVFARLAQAPCQPALMRLGQKQQRGQTRQQRLTQLEGAFWVRSADRIAGQHVVLVDDVITTGATLEAAAKALKAAGAKRVSAVVFAQA